ncbi:MAG: Phosphoenolpyruvate-protein phosphotransferase [Syntrophomonadaceae bacterium]|nr:Phosphoenolpyruvate-protein phosphotransferase [Bacillota bacterium]
MEKAFKGIAASEGIAIGPAIIYQRPILEIFEKKIKEEERPAEIERLKQAVSQAKVELEEIKEKSKKEVGLKEAEIFSAHLMLLDDPLILPVALHKISQKKISAEQAWQEVIEEAAALFEQIEDEYIRARVVDLKDVGERVLRNLQGKREEVLSELPEPSIILAADLTPSDTAQMIFSKVLGFATEQGGRTSHTAIIARTLELPAVVGLGDIISEASNGLTLIVDGYEGLVILDPTPATRRKYQEKKEVYLAEKRKLAELRDLPAQTQDGFRLELAVNIGNPKDAQRARAYHPDGVGLFRTEFLYLDRDSLPEEEEQFQTYKEVAEIFSPKPIVIRTLDIGGDKDIPCLDLPKELNPFLGWRAIRIGLDRPEILKTQLRAILRASPFAQIKLMFPMISTIDEVRKAKALVEEVKKELLHQKVPFEKKVEIGIMIEVPSAALAADILAKEVDFFSIGTNDLIQYTFSADRGNQRVSYLYQPFHPATLRLIKMTVEAAHAHGKWVGMCGEMAGEILATPLLVGLGIDELSMTATSLLRVKQVVRKLSLADCQKLVREVFRLTETSQIEARIKDFLKEKEKSSHSKTFARGSRF